MTREEAIEILKKYKEESEEDYYVKRAGALEMAIEALETRFCEDTISRQEVLKQINCWIGGGEYRYTNATDYLTKRVQDIPSVNPQPKTGHWITTKTFMHNGEFYCDKCKCESPKNEKWDYCPNCGAKMFEPQESEVSE